MKITFFALSSFIAVVLVSSSCGNSGSDEKSGTKNAGNMQQTSEIKPDEVFDGFARLISGNTEKSPSNVDPVYYDSFSKQLNQKLVEIGKSRLTPITNWNQAALKRNVKSDTTSVFYPFSGGDFLHVNSLYPNANHYVMMAQESVGSIQDMTKMDKAKTR